MTVKILQIVLLVEVMTEICDVSSINSKFESGNENPFEMGMKFILFRNRSTEYNIADIGTKRVSHSLFKAPMHNKLDDKQS